MPLRAHDVETLVAYATLAPSGGNAQPWTFRWRDGALECALDAERACSVLDYGQHASHLALGAAAENLVVAAQAMGLAADLEYTPAPEVAWRARFSARSRSAADFAAAGLVAQRVTNRRRGQREPLSPKVAQDLVRCAVAGGGTLHLVEDPAQLHAVGEVLARGDRLRFLSPALHRELYREIHFTGRVHEGLDVRTLELDATAAAGLRLTADRELMDTLRAIDGGQGLGRSARLAIAAASAVGLLRFPVRAAHAAQDYLRAGHVLQRVWLAAQAAGLAFQPWTALVYLFQRLLEDHGAGLPAWETTELRAIYRDYVAVLPPQAGMTDVMLFRLAVAGEPTARSLRRPVADVLQTNGAPREAGC
jgi:nitroreductase